MWKCKNGAMESVGHVHRAFKLLQNDELPGLPELHNAHNRKLWRITSEPVRTLRLMMKEKIQTHPQVLQFCFPEGSQKILTQGSVVSRIVWVRIEGPVCPLFIVCTYVPHKYRNTAPLAQDVIFQIDDLLTNCKKLKPTDCIVLIGDFNCELQRNVQGCTGRRFMNKRTDDGHSSKVMELIRSHDLFSVDSLFRPKRKTQNHVWQHKKSM